MKKNTFYKVLLLISMLYVQKYSYAQSNANLRNASTGQKNNVKKDYQNALSTNLFSGKNPVRGDFSVDLSKDFALSGKLELIPQDRNNIKPWSFVLNGKLGSTNQYTPLFSKGKWAINSDLGLTFNYFFGSNFVHDTILRRLFWVSMDAKYNYNNYLLLKDSIYPTISELTTNTRKSGFQVTPQINVIGVYERTRLKIQISSSLGYTFTYNSSNYEDLTEVKVSAFSTVTDTAGNSIIITSKETTTKKGKLAFSRGHSIYGDLHLTLLGINEDKVSIDFFTKPEYKINADSKILNMLVGINLGVLGSEKSVVNLGFAVNFKNLTKKFEGQQDYKSRIVPAVILGVPIPTIKGRG